MRLATILLIIMVCPGVSAASSDQRSLSYEQRVSAQAAIERVYYAHQIGATKPFEEAMPRAVLASKVRKYLEQTAALSTFWNTEVTDEMLQRELERMAAQTRMPDRLLELYAALGNDPFLIKECLARPALVDRLTRNFYAMDPTRHATERTRAEHLHAQLASGALSPLSDLANRVLMDVAADTTPSAAQPAGADRPVRLRLDPDEFRRRRAELPALAGQVSEFREARDAFTFGVVLSETPSSVRVARYVVPKTSWDTWWAQATGALHAESIPAVASDAGSLPTPGESASTTKLEMEPDTSCAADGWDNGSLALVNKSASNRSAVWTGSLMVIWGGFTGDSAFYTSQGGRYDPATDTWTPTSTTGAPPGRQDATAVWTGSVMVVWGGYLPVNTGGRYDPVSDTWLPTSMIGVPSPRSGHTAVWTGSAMIVWGGWDSGGSALATGGRYDPAMDSWTPTSSINAPSGRANHAAVWSGNSMLVWGGDGGVPANLRTNTGGRYDPVTDTWTTMSTAGAPPARSQHTAVWSGSEMLVWGGYDGSSYTNNGGRYNPVVNSWAGMAGGFPSTRLGHTAVWTGNRMIIWGGSIPFAYRNTGGVYDPATDAWTPTSTISAPVARDYHTAVWTGTRMVVFAGENNGVLLNTGGRYDPSTDSWTPTATFGNSPSVSDRPAVWTGSLMVDWGGNNGFALLNTGERYDPAIDSWTATTTTGAPTARSAHTAVWTGSVMIVWGGNQADAVIGGRYDPLSDSWSPTSTTGAPFPRSSHSAVWTGSSMIIWGGAGSSSGLATATGGRYDPTTDAWAPTSTIGTPTARVGHTAVWTGSQMVVWGGGNSHNPPYINTGGRYDPVTDSWAPTSTVNAPAARTSHTVVWTGTRMIVWSGIQNGPMDNTGGLYDPSGDSWSPTSTSGAPTARHQHTAVWTGNLMVTWGGFTTDGDLLNTGGRYDPATDSWSPTSTSGAPMLLRHTAVWTGSMMIVWGGDAGGRYFVDIGCDDGNACTDDSCDQATGCVHTDNANPCDDGNACTLDDTCSLGACLGGATRNCDDGNACTTDSCDPHSGCVNAPITCDDGNACNGVESCNAATGCVVGTPLVCDDGNACNGVESCSPATGCVAGTPVVCAPPDQCHQAGVCQSSSGTCSYANAPDGTRCDDGNSETNDDVCTGGICAGTACDTHPKPRPSGYYQSLCENGQGHPSRGDALTDADAQCVGRSTTTFAGFSTVADLCGVFANDNQTSHDSDGPDSQACSNAEEELLALALNVCRGYVCESQEVDSGCSGHDGPDDHTRTTVSASLATADSILSDPGRSKDTCQDATCLAREINNGKGIHHISLAVSKEAGLGNALRLTWVNPMMDDGSGPGISYTVWRRPLRADAAFTQIAETSDLTYIDATAGTGVWEYEVRFTIEP